MDKKSGLAPVLTLASASEIRLKLLEGAGISTVARPARIDEEAIRQSLAAEEHGPRDLADALAEFKARKVADAGFTLGCDQILALKGQVFSKAKTRNDAFGQISKLAGQTHHLFSAAVIYEDHEPVWRHVGVVRMTMHDLSAEEIDLYLDKAWPTVASSVGCYQAESLGARLLSRIDGDWFSVLGLPLLEICSFLRLRGWSLS